MEGTKDLREREREREGGGGRGGGREEERSHVLNSVNFYLNLQLK